MEKRHYGNAINGVQNTETGNTRNHQTTSTLLTIDLTATAALGRPGPQTAVRPNTEGGKTPPSARPATLLTALEWRLGHTSHANRADSGDAPSVVDIATFLVGNAGSTASTLRFLTAQRITARRRRPTASRSLLRTRLPPPITTFIDITDVIYISPHRPSAVATAMGTVRMPLLTRDMPDVKYTTRHGLRDVEQRWPASLWTEDLYPRLVVRARIVRAPCGTNSIRDVSLFYFRP